MYQECDYEVVKRRFEKVHNKTFQNTTMVMVKSDDEQDEFLPMENVPKLPPIPRPVEYQYSENPYEIDLSFRSLDVIAFQNPKGGRNQGYRNTFTSYADWEKNYSFALSSGSSDSSQTDSDSDDDKKDNKLQEELLKTTQLVYINQDGKGMVPRLREPRSLYAVAKELGPQQAARWPSDIQVIPDRIKHIEYCPPEPEPFYRKTGLEKSPMVRGEDRGGRLVYQYEPRSTFFVRSRVGGIRTGPEKCTVSIDRAADDPTLIFESRFESGNLAKAVQVGDYEYELWLRYDLYTSKHTQWFYFSIQNTRPNVVYRFSIVNFMKPDSLYNYGMKPLMYSEKDALQKKIGWRRCGLSIKYYRNNLKYDTSKGDRPFYSLTWTTEVPHKGDTVYFSHCYPYTYTDLQDYLLDLSNDPVKSKICKQRVLCRTLAGNLVYVLTITSPSQNPEDIKHKKAVVLTARVHPGESNSSWMMKGFLDYLCSNTADAKLLRDTFIFKIVPMLNPDGVIVGNYRCSLAGRDLNRNYKTVLKDSYPSVWHTKQMIRRLLQERDIVAYCDLHGHSRKQNVFIYGCENRHNPQRRLRERIFPCMLGKNSPGKFAYDLCRFKIQKSKEGTGRVVMWNMGILNSYTMEATFCGSSMGKKKGFHFTAQDFEAMGYDFCDTLLDYCDPDTTKCANILCDLEENLKKEIIKKLEMKGIDTADVDLSDELSEFEMESSDGGSDSSVSDGPPVHLQFAPQRVPKKKKKLKTKKERDRVRGMKEDTSKNAKDKLASDELGPNNKKPLSGHQSSHAKQEKTDYLEALTHAYLRNGILQNQAEQAAPHFRYSGKSPSMPFSLEGLCPHHEQAFAAQLMAQQFQSVSGGQFYRKRFKPVQELNMDDFMRNGMDNPLSPIDRRPKHLLELSAAQQRQQEMLNQQRRGSVPEKSAGSQRSHQHTTEERGMSSRLRAKVPSATYINYDTFKISQMNLEDEDAKQDSVSGQGQRNGSDQVQREGSQVSVEDPNSKKDPHHRHHHAHNGRKSRMAMHDSDDDEQPDRPDFVKDPHSHKTPRVSSAKAGGEEMNSAIQSIKDLRQSLVSTATNSNLSPTAGNYIKRLLKEELRQADEEIDDLTAKLQHNIDEKQKHYDVMLERQEQQSSRKSESGQSDLINSERITPATSKETIVDKPDRPNRTPSASNKPRKEQLVPKPIRTHTNSTSSIGVSPRVPRETPTRVPVESGKVNVDSYSTLPNSKLKVDTNQTRSRKLQETESGVNINSSLKETVSKVNKSMNTAPRRTEPIPNAAVMDLSQVQSQYVLDSQGQVHRQGQGQNRYASSSTQNSYKGSKVLVGKEKTGGSQCGSTSVVDRGRSGSSSSSHDDNSLVEPRSWSVTTEERLDREPVQRVKSARNSSRQVVETVPTKISLMITQDREESRFSGGQFLPTSRSVRAPLHKSAQVNPRRK